MANREQINLRYQSDMEAAEAWRDTNPETYAQKVSEAKDRRISGLEALNEEADQNAAAARLETARTQAKAKYPEIDLDLVTGSTAEEVIASAEKLHKFALGLGATATEAARAASRASRSAGYARGGIPQSGPPAEGGGQVDDAAVASAGRLEQLNREMGQPGPMRDGKLIEAMGKTEYVTRDGPVSTAVMDMRRAGRMRGLSLEAMIQRQTGQAPGSGGGQDLTEEDLRG